MRLARFGGLTAFVTGVAGLVMMASLPTAGAAVTRNPVDAAQFNDRVDAVVVSGDRIFVGGRFTQAKNSAGKWVARGYVAALDASTGALIDTWNPGANATVLALAVSGSTLYLGGSFSSVAGQSSRYLGAVDTASGQPASWSAPAPNKDVYALAVLGGTVYAGGKFTAVGGQTRNRVAAFDAGSGSLLASWKPNASGVVYALAPAWDGSQIYVGGTFSAMNGSATFGFEAGVDPASGANTGWPSDHVYYKVYAFSVSSEGVFAGGGGPGGHLLSWNADGSFRTAPFQTDGGVQAVAAVPGEVFGGGHFTNVCLGNTGHGSPFVCDNPMSRRKLFSIDTSTNDYTSWNPTANSSQGVLALAVVPSTGALAAGGDFTTINAAARQHFALFPAVASG